MPTDTQSTHGAVSGTSFLEPEPALPPWATGVMRSTRAAATEEQMPSPGYVERLDDLTRLHYVQAPGVVVVSLDGGEPQLERGRELMGRLREHELDLMAVSLPTDVMPRLELIERLASERIAIVRAEGASPRDRAIRFVTDFLAKREEGRAQTRRFTKYAAAKAAAR